MYIFVSLGVVFHDLPVTVSIFVFTDDVGDHKEADNFPHGKRHGHMAQGQFLKMPKLDIFIVSFIR